MSDELRDNVYAAQIVASEGVGYAVMDYTSASTFADPETRRLWQECALACCRLEQHLHLFDDELADRTGDIERILSE